LDGVTNLQALFSFFWQLPREGRSSQDPDFNSLAARVNGSVRENLLPASLEGGKRGKVTGGGAHLSHIHHWEPPKPCLVDSFIYADGHKYLNYNIIFKPKAKAPLLKSKRSRGERFMAAANLRQPLNAF